MAETPWRGRRGGRGPSHPDPNPSPDPSPSPNPNPNPNQVGAVPRTEPHFKYKRYAAKCAALYRERRGAPLRTEQPTFNAGVLLIDLERWRAQNLTAEAAWWMRQHAASADGLWALGSQVGGGGWVGKYRVSKSRKVARRGERRLGCFLLVKLTLLTSSLTHSRTHVLTYYTHLVTTSYSLTTSYLLTTSNLPGSQPPLHLALHGRWSALPPSWNLDGLGRVPSLKLAALDGAKLLHWTGRHKPWLPDGMYVERWRRFVPRLCAPSGAARSEEWHRVPWAG
jgi:hypothetical protein